MKKIAVSDLTAGMAYDKAVYIDPENMLARAFEPIKESDIERLKKWDITHVQSMGKPALARKPEEELQYKALSTKERVEVELITKEFRSTVKNIDAFQEIIRKGEITLGEVYEALAKDLPVQISRVRNLAEDLVNIYYNAPLCHFYLYNLLNSPNIYRHVLSASIFGTVLGEAIQFSKPKIVELVFSILLMDVGMMKVPKAIWKKEGKLTELEISQLHAHPVTGYQILTQVAKIKNSIAQVALQHNEQFDGKGYPRKIKADQMSENSKIAAIVDSYTAIIEKKSYRKSKPPHEAMKELLTLGLHRYDSAYLKAFLNKMSFYPMGSLIQTSNDWLGIVIGSTRGKPMRPAIVTIRENNEIPQKPKFVHLLYKPQIYIVSAKSYEEMNIDFEEELTHIGDFLQH